MVWKPRLDIPTAYVFGYTSATVTRPPQSLRTTPSSEATSSCAFFLSFQDMRIVSLPWGTGAGRGALDCGTAFDALDPQALSNAGAQKWPPHSPSRGHSFVSILGKPATTRSSSPRPARPP